jgi:hypothetical protein
MAPKRNSRPNQNRDRRRMTPAERADRADASQDRYLDTFGFPAYQAQQAYDRLIASGNVEGAQQWVPFLNPKLAARYAEWAGVDAGGGGTRPDSDIVRPGQEPIGGAPGPATRKEPWKPSWKPQDGGSKQGGGGRPGPGGGRGGGGRGGGKQGGGGKQQGGKKGQKFQNAAEGLLGGLGIPGDYQKLIRKAVVQGWSLDEFANALLRTPAFRQEFPGLVNEQGWLVVDFTNGLTAGAEALMQAVANYRSGYNNFVDTASAAGYTGKLDKNTFALAIRSGTSVEEFGQRVQLVNTMNSNPDLLNMVNEQRTYAGLAPFSNEFDMLKAAATRSPDFIDNYQAAYLRSQGLNLDAAAGQRLAQAIDSTLGSMADLGQLVAEVRRVRGQIGPELDAAGFNDEYLAGLAGGLDPQNKAGQLQQILSQQQARSQMALQRSPRSQGQRSSSGGFSLFPEDQPQSY